MEEFEAFIDKDKFLEQLEELKRLTQFLKDNRDTTDLEVQTQLIHTGIDCVKLVEELEMKRKLIDIAKTQFKGTALTLFKMYKLVKD